MKNRKVTDSLYENNFSYVHAYNEKTSDREFQKETIFVNISE